MLKTVMNRYKINNTSSQLFKNEIRLRSRSIILRYPMRYKEQKLDQYLRQTYKIGLKQACLKIWSKCQFYTNNGNIDIILQDRDWDNIYQIITYGINNIQGSKILTIAFS